jgi:hypothetical protein
MNENDIIELFRDKAKLFDLVTTAFPEAGIDQGIFEAILHNAKASDKAEMRHFWPIGEQSDEAKRNQAAQDNCESRTLYSLTTTHTRVQPFESAFVEVCQSVRVTLPQSRANAKDTWTHLGLVKASDHKMFSVDEMREHYEAAFSEAPPPIARVDLITGARFLDVVRFSPISIFFAFEKEDDDVPLFYFLESGSVTGQPEVLYYSKNMKDRIFAQAGFAFTPFACSQNWYNSLLTMNTEGTEPLLINIPISQDKDLGRHYLTVDVEYAIEEPGKVTFPGALMIIAVMRVFALGLGMEFDKGVIGRALGEWCRNHTEWTTKPPKHGKPDGYCGCPETQS